MQILCPQLQRVAIHAMPSQHYFHALNAKKREQKIHIVYDLHHKMKWIGIAYQVYVIRPPLAVYQFWKLYLTTLSTKTVTLHAWWLNFDEFKLANCDSLHSEAKKCSMVSICSRLTILGSVRYKRQLITCIYWLHSYAIKTKIQFSIPNRMLSLKYCIWLQQNNLKSNHIKTSTFYAQLNSKQWWFSLI